MNSLESRVARCELAQSRVRLGVAVFMFCYFVFSGFLFHPLYISFLAYSVGWYWLIQSRLSTKSPVRISLSLAIDLFFTVAGLFVTEETGVFLFILMLQISFGYGLRFGKKYVNLASASSCLSVVALYVFSTYWNGQPHTLIAYFVGVPFLSLYIFYLNNAVERARAKAEHSSNRNAEILSFLSHDVRTQMQALLDSLERIEARLTDADLQYQLLSIRRNLNSLAELSSGVATEYDVFQVATGDEIKSVSLVDWFSNSIGRFDSSIKAAGLRFVIDIENIGIAHFYADAAVLDRIVLNLVSNSIAHSTGETISINLRVHANSSSDGKFVLEIKNDTGEMRTPEIGLEQEKSPKRFWSGSGKGLKSVQKLVSDSGGTLDFGSKSGKTFDCRVEIPVVPNPTLRAETLTTPVLLLSANRTYYFELSKMMSSVCNLYLCSSTDSLEALSKKLHSAPDCLLVDFSSMPTFPELGEHLSGRTRACCVLVSAQEWQLFKMFSGNFLVTTSKQDNPEVLATKLQLTAGVNRGSESMSPPRSGRRTRTDILDGFRLLLIDDSSVGAAKVKNILENSGAIVEILDLSSDFVAQLITFRPDLVLTDWFLESETAKNLIEQIGKMGATIPRPSVVVFSAAEPDVLETLDPNIQVLDFIQRPVSNETLVRRISQLLDGSPPHARDGTRNLANSLLERYMLFDMQSFLSDFSMENESRLMSTLTNQFVTEVEKNVHSLPRETDKDDFARKLHAIASACAVMFCDALFEYCSRTVKELKRFETVSEARKELIIQDVEMLWIRTAPHLICFAHMCNEQDKELQ